MSSTKNNGDFLYKDRVLLTEKSKKIKKLELLTSNLISQFCKKLKNKNQKILDKDKTNLEHINLFSYYHKKYTSEYNKRKQNTYSNGLFNNKKNIFLNLEKTDNNENKNIFNNKYIRNCNKKVQTNQICINDYNNSFLNTKTYCFSLEKRKKIKDDNKINNISKEKKIELKELKTQDKSNFNNKVNLLYKSPNLKKKEEIKKYFSLIKNMKNHDLFKKKIINKKQKLYNDKGNVYKQSMHFRNYPVVKITKKNYNSKLKKKLNENKKKLYIPILSRNYTDNNITSENMEKMDDCNFVSEIDFISSSRNNNNSFFKTQM